MRISFGSSLIVLLALASCNGADKDGSDASVQTDTQGGFDSWAEVVDNDSDGIAEDDGDCDDDDPEMYPGRAEDCDGVDNNCNGVTDEGWPDNDRDLTADCQDTEDCDGLDNDGDGATDEDFSDSDHDGVADCVGTEACDGVDNDGDGDVDEGYDADGDGYTSCGSDADCEDADAAIHPDANEDATDFVDNDCDGLIDETAWAYGDIAVTEIMNNPAQVPDPDGEWIEIYNASERTLILNGLVLSDSGGESHQITDENPILLDPGDFFVLTANKEEEDNGHVVSDYKFSGLVLQNESDDLAIYAGATLVDRIEWDDGATMPDPSGASMGTDRGNYSASINDDPTAWCVATQIWTGNSTADKGSPGEDNEFCSTYDHDGDGFNVDQGDCDDDDATTYPDAWEGYDASGAVDNDCDGVAETASTAVASSTGTGFTCDDIQLDGSLSSDIESAALIYSWELSGAPFGSVTTTADIATPTSMSPSFTPDIAGDYTFTLTVNDGGTDSAPESITVTVTTRGTETAPVSDAGPDQSTSDTIACTSSSYGTVWTCSDCADSTVTLDGTGSSDVDGDDLEYAWTVTSGTTYGTLTNSTSTQPTLTISGVPGTYGVDTTETMDVSLVVTDCMGSSSTDSVSITYTCTGA